MSAPTVSARNAFRVWQRNAAVYRKTWRLNILPNFFEPVVYLAAMGFGLGAYVTREMEGMSYLQFIAPGLLAASAMNGGTFETTYNVFVKMHFTKTYEAITATPITFADAMAGEVLWGVTRGMIYGVAFTLVMGALGLFQSWTAVFVLPLIVLTAWFFAATGLLYTSFIRIIDLYSFYYTLWLTPLFLFSGIFFPVSGLPEWARVVAWFTPLYHCVNLFQAASHGAWSPARWIDLVWILAVGTGISFLAIRRVERRFVV